MDEFAVGTGLFQALVDSNKYAKYFLPYIILNSSESFEHERLPSF